MCKYNRLEVYMPHALVLYDISIYLYIEYIHECKQAAKTIETRSLVLYIYQWSVYVCVCVCVSLGIYYSNTKSGNCKQLNTDTCTLVLINSLICINNSIAIMYNLVNISKTTNILWIDHMLLARKRIASCFNKMMLFNNYRKNVL